MNDERLKPLSRRRLLIAGGAGGVVLAAVGLGSLRQRAQVGQNTNGATGVGPEAKMTVLTFIGALFGKDLSEQDLADLSDRLNYLLSSDTVLNRTSAVLVHHLDRLAIKGGATTFRSSSASQKQSIVDQIMRIDYKSNLSRLLSKLSASERDYYHMRWSVVPQLAWLYRNSAVPWRARGYARWPGIPGDWHEIVTPGAPYP